MVKGMSKNAQFAELLSNTLTFIEQEYKPTDSVFSFEKTVSSQPAKKVAQEKPSPPPPKPTQPPPPKKPPPPPIKVEQTPPPPKIDPEPPLIEKPKLAPHSEGMADIKALLVRLAPHLLTEEPIPDDAAAKRAAEAWKHETHASVVTVLSLGASQDETTFLRNVARAISTTLQPAKVVSAQELEQDNLWETVLQTPGLKWILSPPLNMVQWPNLSAYYKHNTTTQVHTLGNIPLIFLKPLTDYLENPILKKELWDTLCQLL